MKKVRWKQSPPTAGNVQKASPPPVCPARRSDSARGARRTQRGSCEVASQATSPPLVCEPRPTYEREGCSEQLAMSN